jgi:tRNA-splicing ligase RtcB
MDPARLTRKSDVEWWIEPAGRMHVPGILYATEALIRDMDDKVFEQMSNVATLPGIARASFAMPDAHWGYGFPIGGVAAFDPGRGGVVSAGGVGFDISCGVRTLVTGITRESLGDRQRALADDLARVIPAGVGSAGSLRLDDDEMDAMLAGGAQWAVARGYGAPADLDRIEERGRAADARPEEVSAQAKRRQRDEVGTLGSGNHYLEVQRVATVFDRNTAAAFGLHEGDLVVSIHCGSRGLGHQVGSDFLRRMAIEAPRHGLAYLPDRELASAPIESPTGRAYLGAMRAAINCALANRQVLTHLVRAAFSRIVPEATLSLVYDVSHNTCKVETHRIDGEDRRLFVHRKGATKALGPGHPDLPADLRAVGQPVLIGGTMGTASYVLVGTAAGLQRSLGSSCHGAGRRMSRHQALRQFRGREIVDRLARRGILIRSPSSRGVAEEAPDAYKDVEAVVDAADRAGLSRKVARLEPVICIKG